MEQLKNMKHKLTECVEKQINGNLEYTNVEELGEAVDMIKDLSEAIYYCTITEAMEGKAGVSNGGHYPAAHYYGESMSRNYPEDHIYPSHSQPIMYASNGSTGSSSSYYTPITYAQDGARQSAGESRYYSPMYASNGGSTSSHMYPSPEYMYPPMNVEYDGRSYMMRRKYMDGRKYNDKQTQMQELEKYTQELASDITDMIRDASPEEKTMLQQKIQMLATKIK
jgi:hypothetical protein